MNHKREADRESTSQCACRAYKEDKLKGERPYHISEVLLFQTFIVRSNGYYAGFVLITGNVKEARNVK